MKGVLLGFASVLIVTTVEMGCQKTSERQKDCLKGKIVATKCMGTIIQITEGNYDPALVTPKWSDTLRMQQGQPVTEFSNVFRLINPCDHQDLTEGKEFYFKIKTNGEAEKCNYCLAYDIAPPPSKLSISVCGTVTTK